MFSLIAGNCVIESEETVMETAEQLKEITEELQIPFTFKASFDKANRTSIHSFRGLGIDEGLRILNKVNDDTNKKIINAMALFFIAYCLIIIPSGIIKIGAFDNTLLFYISFAGYGLFGYFLANTDLTNIADKLKLSKKTVFLISFALFILLYAYSLVKITNLSLAYNRLTTFPYFGILTLALTSTVFLSFRYFEEAYKDNANSLFMKIKNGKAGMILNSLSKCSFGIYFVHPLVYVFYKDILFASMNILNRSPVKWSLLLIALVLFTSWAIILIMSKIPYLDKVSGA